MLQTVNSQSYAPYTSPYMRKKREHLPLVVEADKFIADLDKNNTDNNVGIDRRMGRTSVIIAGGSTESTIANYSTTNPPVTNPPEDLTVFQNTWIFYVKWQRIFVTSIEV